MKRQFILLVTLCIALFTQADVPFRNHRFDTFKVMPINEQSIVFVGNSISDMHLWSEAWGNDPRVVDRGNSGAISSEILANALSYCSGHPAKIFVMIGTNDLGTEGITEEEMVNNIEQTIEIFRKESPKTEVYIESILPSDIGLRTFERTESANRAIQQMLTRHPEVTYIDLHTPLKDKVGVDDDYSYDHLHLTAAGYQVWLSEIEKYMDGLHSIYPPQTAALQVSIGLPHNSFGMRGTYFSMMPLQEDDILFFGDEMVKNGEWAELLGTPRVKNRGTNWGYEGRSHGMNYVSGGIDCTFASVRGVSKRAPRHLLLYTGTGEVNSGMGLQTIIANYTALIAKMRHYAPTARISVVSLMPVNTYDNSRVQAFNAALRQLAASHDNVEYVDINSALTLPDGTPDPACFPCADNYIYGEGYLRIAKILKKIL